MARRGKTRQGKVIIKNINKGRMKERKNKCKL